MGSSVYDGSVDYEKGICIHAPASGSRRFEYTARVNV
jgi:hypothetical protein